MRKDRLIRKILFVFEFVFFLIMDFLYLVIRLLISSDWIYIVVLLFHFLPLLITGFLYWKGNQVWQLGKYILCCNYNQIYKIGLENREYEYSYVTPVFSIEYKFFRLLLEVVVIIALYLSGRKIFQKKRII